VEGAAIVDDVQALCAGAASVGRGNDGGLTTATGGGVVESPIRFYAPRIQAAARGLVA